MTKINDTDQKTFKVNQTHKFKILGEGLDIVTDPKQVGLSTKATMNSGKKKLKWGAVQKILESAADHIKVMADLNAVDQAAKPVSWLGRLLAWLWAILLRLWHLDTFGDLNITITDSMGTQVATGTFTVTYQS